MHASVDCAFTICGNFVRYYEGWVVRIMASFMYVEVVMEIVMSLTYTGTVSMVNGLHNQIATRSWTFKVLRDPHLSTSNLQLTEVGSQVKSVGVSK
jgi:hypothetical protein